MFDLLILCFLKKILGVLFSEVLNRMKQVAEKRLDIRQKFYAYSAHDTSIAAILVAFDIRPETFPSYASLVLLELHENEKNEFYVKVFICFFI